MVYDILKILLQTGFWAGLCVLVCISALLAVLARRILLYFDARVLPAWNHHLVYWGMERLALPLGRAIGVMTFLLLAYPEIYGFASASVPDVWSVLNAEPRRPNYLLNVLFFSSLFVSLVPVLGRLPALVLPVQGITGATLLFHWLNAALDAKQPVAVNHWPGFILTVVIVFVASGMQLIATPVVKRIEDRSDASANRPRLISLLMGEWILAVSSLVPVLMYTVFLGRQMVAAATG